MEENIVDVNQRYSAATAETVARIGARDHVLEIFVTLSAALIAFAVGQNGRPFYGVIIGFAALATALLSRHHDVIIGLLGEFQCKLADYRPKVQEDAPVPNWFSSNEYFTDVMRERVYRDCSLFMFLLTAGLMGLYLALATLPRDPVRKTIDFFYGDPLVLTWDLSAFFWILSLLVVIWTGYTRWELLRSRTKNKQIFRHVFAAPLAVILISLAVFVAAALQHSIH